MRNLCRRRGDERGFTLLEILIAMTILMMGGVLVISLFAAAVAMQYESEVDKQKAEILNEIVAETQAAFNAYDPEPNQPVPPPIERKPAPGESGDFEYSVVFATAPHVPEGEGATATITLYYKENPLEPVTRILQRTVFTKKAREELLSYERDQQADREAEDEKEPDRSNR
jgi:type II secretory pathway pseudopilin PulG